MTQQPVTEVPDAELEELLEFIRDARGFDFTGYKRTTLQRRLRRRMDEAGTAKLEEYRDLLETSAEEFTLLFNMMLINVTSFFRDPEAWTYLRLNVIPAIIESSGADELRVWSSGCSTGEEAYSLAIVFADTMGIREFTDRCKIYATDVDGEALLTARKGVYSDKQAEAIPLEFHDTYLEPAGSRVTVIPELRHRVIFGRHDIVTDAPISRLDLLVCRNTLMYFTAEAQQQILSRFHFALNKHSYLMLGKAEMLMANGSRFVNESVAHRMFRSYPDARVSSRTLAPVDVARSMIGEVAQHRQVRDLAVESAPAPQLLVDAQGVVVQVNAQARMMFGLTIHDEGRALRDLEVSYRPVELRSLIEQAQLQRAPVRRNAVERQAGPDDVEYHDVHVSPLISPEGVFVGAGVSFVEVTPTMRLRHDLKAAREELETTTEELQSTNEELETTNEELQSSNEELETTNEELQSTNEELETTNEELQSTNEELETMNDELRMRSEELDVVNTFLAAVLKSAPMGLVVLDDQTRVRSWNRAAEQLWGLRGDEVLNRPFFALEFGLPTGALREAIDACLRQTPVEQRTQVEAVDRLGRRIVCDVRCTAFSGGTKGIVVTMEAVEQT